MLQDTLANNADPLEDFDRQGIAYKPMIFTAYGRRHPRATNMLHHAATTMARQRGYANANGLQTHWQRQLAAEIWHRTARIVRVCHSKW